MNSRKRLAPEPLLPLRSAKQSRTGLLSHSGERASPSQYEGILSRWISLGKEFWSLGWDTVSHLVPDLKHKEALPLPLHHNPTLVSRPPTFLPQVPLIPPKHKHVPSSPRQRRSLQMSSSSPSTPCPHDPESITSQGSRRTSDAFPPPTATVSASAISVPSSSKFRIDNILSASTQLLSLDDNFIRATPRPYQNREHIFAKTHKAQVQAERKKDREELQKELYQYKRHYGYSSDYQTFKSLLSYGEKLERLERREVLSPSSSLTDLRLKPAARARRHSSSEDINIAFLERALEKARETLNGPKPPKPFNPHLDQYKRAIRAKDEEIERRLRPKGLPPTLPDAEEAKVDTILRKRGVIAKFAREQVTDHDLVKLRPTQWLNDEIINFYGAMILARSDECKENPGANSKKRPLNAHYFSTFFWSKLKGEGYDKARLAKWTKKLDIFSKDIILIPINHNNMHWTGAAINFRRKRIESYDSMGMERQAVFKLLRSYLDAEHRNKKKKPFDFTGWEDYTSQDTPLQENGYDCGVFTCQFLEQLSRGEERFNFTQKDMPYLRRRMIWEIGNTTLRNDP